MGRISSFAIAFGLSLLGLHCTSDWSTPQIPPEAKRRLDTVIVTSGPLGPVGGRGYYAKPLTWSVIYNPVGGDSVLRVLLSANLAVEEFWCPKAASICLDPFLHEREIVKLTEPDRAITRLGFMPLAPGYSDYCLIDWRHYRVVWNP